MLKSFPIKFMSLIMLLSIHSSFAHADSDSILAQLPFGIKLGQTTNEEIENKGVCTNKIQVSESYFRCQTYNMLNGKFNVNSSQNEIVSTISFLGQIGHSLPQSWQNAGLKLSPSFNYGELNGGAMGNTVNEFIAIIKSNRATNIRLENKDTRGNSKYGFGSVNKIVSFDIGSNHYTANFQTEFGYNTITSQDVTRERGLISLEISETY